MAATVAPPGFGERLGRFADRRFKYLTIWPAVLVLLLIGIFPLIYTLIVSFQHITMMTEDTSFCGFINYALLYTDPLLWGAIILTAVFTGLALPFELEPGFSLPPALLWLGGPLPCLRSPLTAFSEPGSAAGGAAGSPSLPEP